MKRLLDLAVVVPALLLLTPLLLLLALLVKCSSPGPVLYWSDRVGRNNAIFRMPKFRSMRTDTPEVATDQLDNPQAWLTSIGPFLRKSSLDELPQLWSILRGDMSLVGPRPALFNQYDLIAQRTQAGVHRLTPGLTGWAQINGRDELPLAVKVEMDIYYLKHSSFALDLEILLTTFVKAIHGTNVSH